MTPGREPPSAPAFGPLLRTFRLAAGLSQEQLAERARISTAAVSALERGIRRSPQRQTLALIATALQLSDSERAALEGSAQRFRTRPATEPEADPWLATVPTFLSSFVGREREVAELVLLLGQKRLVTITGAGGSGKTRLACAVAPLRVTSPGDRMLFAELASFSEGAFLLPYLASLAGVNMAEATDVIDAIATKMRGTRVLLVLDNCEHIVETVVPVVVRLLNNCPMMTILATSRERLGVGGEVVYRLGPLFIPAGDVPRDLQAAAALRLFADRAAAADPHFALDGRNVADVADVCRRLDGMPLAIELAVARLPMLGLHDLRRRLSQQFELAGMHRDAPDRHATMQAVIAWSYDLLDADERLLMDRVGIFAGGFTLAAAEIICTDDRLGRTDVFGLLYRLVEKSLVQAHHENARARYTLLEPVRHYSIQRLTDDDAFPAIALRHAQWIAGFADVVGDKEREQSANTMRDFVTEAVNEIDNIRAALERLTKSEADDDIVLAARIATGLRGIWFREGLFFEGTRWALLILDRLDEALHPALAAGVAQFLFQMSTSSTEIAALDRVAPIFMRTGKIEGLAILYIHTSHRASERGDFERANQLADECARLFENHPDETSAHGMFHRHRAFLHALQGRILEARAALGTAAVIEANDARNLTRAAHLGMLAEIESLAGNHQAALDAVQAMRPIIAGESRIHEVAVYANIASYCIYLRRYDEAASAVHAALLRSGQLDDFSVRVALLVAAVCLGQLGAYSDAALLFGYAARPAVTLHRVWTPTETGMIDPLVTTLRAALADDYDALIDAGAQITLAEARELAFTLTSAESDIS